MGEACGERGPPCVPQGPQFTHLSIRRSRAGVAPTPIPQFCPLNPPHIAPLCVRTKPSSRWRSVWKTRPQKHTLLGVSRCISSLA